MTIAALRDSPPTLALHLRIASSRWLWCVVAAAFVVMRDMQSGPGLAVALGDTDDATRLIQVREFLAGAGWFDLSLPVFGGPTPLVSHWSRLIDLPIALLMIAFATVTPLDTAELLARAAWPTLVLIVFFRLLAREAEARGGETAAWVTLMFAATTLSGLFQFKIGRIDHHNVMILSTVIGALMLARGLTTPSLGWLAGFWLGFALVIGYEPLAFIVPLAGLAALAAVVHTAWLPAVRNAACAMAATMVVGLLTTTPIWLWGVSVCDALAPNIVAAIAIGAAGLALIAHHAERTRVMTRLGFLVATGGVAVAAYLVANPACLGGPFAAVDAEVQRVWLSTVIETRPLTRLFAINPTPVVIFAIFVAAGLVAALLRFRQERSAESLATLVVLAALVPPAIWQTKFIPYASFVAAIAIALTVSRFTGAGQLTPLSAKLIGVLGLNQATLALVAGMLLTLGGTSKAVVEGKALASIEACMRTDAVAPLGTLPAGLVVSGVDLGPFIAATTPHRVYAAPYHRIDAAIGTSHRLFAEGSATAERTLRDLKATYVVDCLPAYGDSDAPLPPWATAASLYTQLQRGAPPPFLVEVPNASPEAALKVWRVVPR